MAKIISFDTKKTGGVMQAMRRLWTVSIPATAVLSGTMAVAFAIAIDGCSNSSNKKTDVSSSLNSTGVSKSLPTPTPSVLSEKTTLTTKKKSPVQHASVAYVDNGSGVSLRYPRGYTLMTPEKAKLNSELLDRVPMNFVQPGGVKVATIALPGKLATPLLGVNVHKGLTADQCEQFADPMPPMWPTAPRLTPATNPSPPRSACGAASSRVWRTAPSRLIPVTITTSRTARATSLCWP